MRTAGRIPSPGASRDCAPQLGQLCDSRSHPTAKALRLGGARPARQTRLGHAADPALVPEENLRGVASAALWETGLPLPAVLARLLGRNGHRETLPPLCPAPFENGAAAGSRHPCTKAVSPFASAVVRLIRSFHDCLVGNRHWPRSPWLNHPRPSFLSARTFL